jgi:hypothetical protein
MPAKSAGRFSADRSASSPQWNFGALLETLQKQVPVVRLQDDDGNFSLAAFDTSENARDRAATKRWNRH